LTPKFSLQSLGFVTVGIVWWTTDAGWSLARLWGFRSQYPWSYRGRV